MSFMSCTTSDSPAASALISARSLPQKVACSGPPVGASDVVGDSVNDGAGVGLALTEPPPQAQHMMIDEKSVSSTRPQSLGVLSYHEEQPSPYGSVAPSSVSKHSPLVVRRRPRRGADAAQAQPPQSQPS